MKHCFQECFLGAQTSGKQCFLAAKTKKHCTENKRLCMLNIRSVAHTTLKSTNVVNIVSSVHKWGKNVYYRNQMFPKKVRNIFFLSRKQKMFPQQMFRMCANGKTFREACFCNISSFAGALICRLKQA